MAVDYNMLFQTPNAGAAFAQAFQQGMKKNAINALMQNPSDPKALAAYGQYDPEGALSYKLKQQQLDAENARKQVEQFQSTIDSGASMLQRLTAGGMPLEQAYQVTRQTLISNRFPGADHIPPQADEQYIKGIMAMAKPETQQRPQIVTTQAGGGVFRIDPATGQAIPLILPNDGSHAPGSPANMPRVTDQASYDAIPPGGQYMDPQGNIRTKGGQSGAGSAGGFPSGGQ